MALAGTEWQYQRGQSHKGAVDGHPSARRRAGQSQRGICWYEGDSTEVLVDTGHDVQCNGRGHEARSIERQVMVARENRYPFGSDLCELTVYAGDDGWRCGTEAHLSPVGHERNIDALALVATGHLELSLPRLVAGLFGAQGIAARFEYQLG